MKRKYTSLPYKEETVHEDRFDISRSPIEYVIIHTTVGSMQSAINLFANKPQPGKETSAHYGVKLDGGIIAWLEEYYTGYHCGNYQMNQKSIGIEHEDNWNGKDPEPERTDALYETSSKLVYDICKFYSIPIDRTHILKHKEVKGVATACPDKLDIDRIIKGAVSLQDAPGSSNCEKVVKELTKTQKLLEEALTEKDKYKTETRDSRKTISDLQDTVQKAKDLTSDFEQRLNTEKELHVKASDEANIYKANYERATETIGEKETQIVELKDKISLLKSKKLSVKESLSQLTEAIKDRRW